MWTDKAADSSQTSLPAIVSFTDCPFSMARETMLSMARPAALLLLPASFLTAATLLETSATRPSMPETALLASFSVCTFKTGMQP